jgi:ketosteroid isomerase-like protein
MRTGTWGALAAVILAGAAIITAAGPPSADEDLAALAEQVREAELAFAKTMADRDHKAFGMFIAEEAVFFAGQEVLRGRAKVMEGWKPLYQGEQAPFSWEPKEVEVLDSGGLALSSGPVRDPQGNQVGTFMSIWRREADGKWRVTFDKGCPPCKCP